MCLDLQVLSHHLQVNQLPLSSMKDYADSITNPPEPVAPAQTPDADEESGEPEPDV